MIWDEAEKTDRIILEGILKCFERNFRTHINSGVEMKLADPPLNDPNFPCSDIVRTREATNPVKTS